MLVRLCPNDVIKLWESSREDETESAKVAAWVKANEGKLLRSNNVPEGYYIRKQYGSTDLCGPRTMPYNDMFRFTLAHSDTGVRIPTLDEFRELGTNPSYYRGAEGRNRKRASMTLENAEAVAQATNALINAQEAFDALNGPVPDFYAIRRMSGLSKD